MRYGNRENNLISLLAYASTQATWTAATTLAKQTGVAYATVHIYLTRDFFGQVAYHFRYDYRILRRPHQRVGYGHTYYLSAVSKGYA